MAEQKEKFSNYYAYLSKESKKDFAALVKSYGGVLSTTVIEDWNSDNDLGLILSQLDDLLHIDLEILDEWSTL